MYNCKTRTSYTEISSAKYEKLFCNISTDFVLPDDLQFNVLLHTITGFRYNQVSF
jgi:hypothetical protein